MMHLLGPALQSWDGRRPEPIQVNGTGPSDRPSASDEVDLTTLALAPSTGDAEGWDIRWRFRASGQGNACFMIVDGARLQARLERWGNFFCTQAVGPGQDAQRAVLARSGTAEVAHGIEYSDEDAPELGGGCRTGRIAWRPFRVLAWDAPDPRLGGTRRARLPATYDGMPLFGVCGSLRGDMDWS